MKLGHAGWGHPRRPGHGGEVWQSVGHWREWQTTSVFLPGEPHEQYEKAKLKGTERGTPQVGRCTICYWPSTVCNNCICWSLICQQSIPWARMLNAFFLSPWCASSQYTVCFPSSSCRWCTTPCHAFCQVLAHTVPIRNKKTSSKRQQPWGGHWSPISCSALSV